MKKFAIAAALIFVNSLLLWLAAEAFLYVKNYGWVLTRPPVSFNVRFSRGYRFAYDRLRRGDFDDPDSPLLLPTGFGDRAIVRPNPTSRVQKAMFPAHELDDSLKHEGGFWVPGTLAMRPSRSTRSIMRSRDGRTLYDVTYDIDEFGRRKTDLPNPARRGRHLLFFGCSFTFGEGLTQAETIPSGIARRMPDHRVYNYGTQGAGPQDLLARIEDTDFGKEVGEKPGLGVYLFIPDHIRRSVPSIIYLAYRMKRPFYYEDEATGHVHRAKTYGEVHPLLNLLLRILSESEILAHLRMDVRIAYGEEDFRKTAQLIGKMSEAYKRKFPGNEFYTVLYPYPWFQGVMQGYLAHYGVKILDYTPFALEKYVHGIRESIDAHPSPEEADVMADQIARDLKKASAL